jgi:hypothetical protein
MHRSPGVKEQEEDQMDRPNRVEWSWAAAMWAALCLAVGVLLMKILLLILLRIP